jgi:hypothetical protein
VEFEIVEFGSSDYLLPSATNSALSVARTPDYLNSLPCCGARLNFCNVTVDKPQGVTASIPAVREVTLRRRAIFRLHGRNPSTWNLRD